MGRVFVAGSINMDVVATADRHPRIGETVAGRAVLYFPGGKGANQAVSAAKLGAPTTLIGCIGQDAFGEELKAFLATQGIDLSFVRETNQAHTGTAIITIANADNTIVVVPGANASVSDADVTAAVLSQDDIAVSQFEIPLPTFSPSSSAPVPPARPRSSIRHRRSHSTPNCSISSIFSSSMRASLAC
jgi:ribokinase